VVVVWRLDRLGRNLKHLVTLLDELQALGVGFSPRWWVLPCRWAWRRQGCRRLPETTCR
jgi:hypothetical protein